MKLYSNKEGHKRVWRLRVEAGRIESMCFLFTKMGYREYTRVKMDSIEMGGVNLK